LRPRSNCFYKMRSGFAIAALGLLVAALIMTPQAALAIPRQDGASVAMARLHVEELALGIGPRPAGTMRESAAADYVAEVLEEYGYAVSRVPFSRETADGVSVSENVIAVSPTAKPGARIVLIGASLDTCGLDSPGADHNASGLAAMLEAARLLSGLPGRGRSEVAFAAFGSNEMGRAGAKAFTEGKGAGPVDPRDVAMMINVDAVGRGDSVRLIPWGGPRAFPPKAFERLAEAVAGSTGLRVEFDTVIAMMPQVHTDHSPFLVTGTPAVTITTARSLPYYRSDSLEPYRDVASEASGANVARAADGVVAAARWAASAYSIGKPGDTYISFRMLGGEIVSIPYVVSLVLAAIAVFGGVVCIAYARSLLMDEFSWVQSAGLIHTIGMSAAMYAITAVLIWTAFLPSAIVEAVPGRERPWKAYSVAAHYCRSRVRALFCGADSLPYRHQAEGDAPYSDTPSLHDLADSLCLPLCGDHAGRRSSLCSGACLHGGCHFSARRLRTEGLCFPCSCACSVAGSQSGSWCWKLGIPGSLVSSSIPFSIGLSSCAALRHGHCCSAI